MLKNWYVFFYTFLHFLKSQIEHSCVRIQRSFLRWRFQNRIPVIYTSLWFAFAIQYFMEICSSQRVNWFFQWINIPRQEYDISKIHFAILHERHSLFSFFCQNNAAKTSYYTLYLNLTLSFPWDRVPGIAGSESISILHFHGCCPIAFSKGFNSFIFHQQFMRAFFPTSPAATGVKRYSYPCVVSLTTRK